MSMIERGRAAFDGRAWGQARELLAAADVESPLSADDLALLAMAAHLSGDDDFSDEVRHRLFHQCVEDSDAPGASRAAFFLGMSLMFRGERAQGGADKTLHLPHMQRRLTRWAHPSCAVGGHPYQRRE